VRAYQPPAPSLQPGRVVFVERADGRHEATVRSAAAHGRGIVLVALDGIADRGAAEALVGSRLLVRAADLAPVADGEFYYHEVAGFAVETAAGEPLGTIAETFPTGLNDVWVVRGGQREYLIPVIAEVVRSLDRAVGRIVIDPMPGLLD
jgi:16S rRNA processing protein RimM